MATSWTLVVAAPLARVAASVEPLAVKPALSALGEGATVARFESEASAPGGLAYELRGLLGAVVDEVGPEGLRAVDALDGVADLEGARKAPGAYLTAPPASPFADAAALFGTSRRAEAPAVKAPGDLAAKVGAVLDARESPAAMEQKLRASRGIAEWGAAFGVTPAAGEAPAPDATRARDAMRDDLRAEHPATPEAPPERSAKRRELEDLVRHNDEDDAAGDDAAKPKGPAGGA